jgi:hypothetical protein
MFFTIQQALPGLPMPFLGAIVLMWLMFCVSVWPE